MAYQPYRDFSLDIPAGLIIGKTSINKFGINRAINIAADEDIWSRGALWVPPTNARTHDLASTEAIDAAAGIGARTVLVQGLDAAWTLQEETITMNGATNVATANAYVRIFRMIVVTAGANGTNAGIITATAQVDGTVTAEIATGTSQTEMAIYTVPAAKTAYVTSYYFALNRSTTPAGAMIDIHFLVRPDASLANAPLVSKHVLGLNINSGRDHAFNPYLMVGARSDIIIRGVNASDNNSRVSAGFDLILVDD